MSLSREEVRKIVDGEVEFAAKWDKERPAGSLADADKPVEVWLLWIDVYLQKAKDAATSGFNKAAALENIRCILNLAETCAMHHGLPARADAKDSYGC